MADQGPIPLSSIRTLLLTSHAQTAHRRSPPIPQLSCVDSDPSLCRLARSSITTMTCTSLGSDGPGASDGGREDEPSAAAADIQWSCQADLPEEIRLGATHVVCEGYDSPADTDVLRGSCGVRYTVGLTDLGEDRSRPPHLLRRRSGSGSGPAGGEEQAETRSSRAAPYLFWLIFSAVLVRILYGAYVRAARPRRGAQFRRGNPGRRRHGGGRDDDGNDDGNDDDDDDDDRFPPAYRHGSLPSVFNSGPAAAGAGAAAASRFRDRDPSSLASSSTSVYVSGNRHESTGFGGTTRR